MVPSQYRLAAELVEMVHEVSQGFHTGYRGVHPQGRYILQAHIPNLGQYPFLISTFLSTLWL